MCIVPLCMFFYLSLSQNVLGGVLLEVCGEKSKRPLACMNYSAQKQCNLISYLLIWCNRNLQDSWLLIRPISHKFLEGRQSYHDSPHFVFTRTELYYFFHRTKPAEATASKYPIGLQTRCSPRDSILITVGLAVACLALRFRGRIYERSNLRTLTALMNTRVLSSDVSLRVSEIISIYIFKSILYLRTTIANSPSNLQIIFNITSSFKYNFQNPLLHVSSPPILHCGRRTNATITRFIRPLLSTTIRAASQNMGDHSQHAQKSRVNLHSRYIQYTERPVVL